MTHRGSGDTEPSTGADHHQAQARLPSPELKPGWAGTSELSCTKGSVYVRPGFHWIAFDAYLFDIDGTLLNSQDAVHYHAFHHAVAQVFGLDFRVEGIPIHGNTDVGILSAYLEGANIPENQWRPRLPQVLEQMSEEVERNCSSLRPQVCPAITDLIARLKGHNKLLGVASGNLERVGWAKLHACGLRDHFSFGAFSGDLEKRDDIIAHGIRQARAIRGEEVAVCVVGDTPADIRSAHANGIPAIAVATGIYSVQELLVHEPQICVPCCNDLLQLG